MHPHAISCWVRSSKDGVASLIDVSSFEWRMCKKTWKSISREVKFLNLSVAIKVIHVCCLSSLRNMYSKRILEHFSAYLGSARQSAEGFGPRHGVFWNMGGPSRSCTSHDNSNTGEPLLGPEAKRGQRVPHVHLRNDDIYLLRWYWGLGSCLQGRMLAYDPWRHHRLESEMRSDSR